MRFRLAHMSDPHLGPVPTPSPGELMSKRAFGYANWLRNRKSALGTEILERLVADIRDHRPDHICVTGDLVNIATDAEIEGARRWLEALGPPSKVSVVPGNHDAYVRGAVDRALRAWAPYAQPGPYPTVRRFGGVALIGVSTAVATPPLFASGRVGPEQLASLAAVLDRNDDAFKVVMIHHPPDVGLSSGRRGLADVEAVRETLSSGCANIVLHGHTHEPSLVWLRTSRGRAAIVGVPSASSDGSKHTAASWAMIDIDPRTQRTRLVRRGIGGGGGAVRALQSVDLEQAARERL